MCEKTKECAPLGWNKWNRLGGRMKLVGGQGHFLTRTCVCRSQDEIIDATGQRLETAAVSIQQTSDLFRLFSSQRREKVATPPLFRFAGLFISVSHLLTLSEVHPAVAGLLLPLLLPWLFHPPRNHPVPPFKGQRSRWIFQNSNKTTKTSTNSISTDWRNEIKSDEMWSK